MDKPVGPDAMYLAPGAHAASGAASPRALRCPGAGQTWPHVDDHVVEPGSGQELIDGVIVELTPGGPAHSDTQAAIARLLGMCVADGYRVSVELLTRTSEAWNFAADVGIRKLGRDPATGRRYLEEVVFEVRDSQRDKDLERRAHELSRRGVRRIFAIDAQLTDADDDSSPVIVGPVREWSAKQCWQPVADTDVIADQTLRRPLQVRAFLDATAASDDIVRTLLTQAHPVLVARERDVRAAGQADGLRRAIAGTCDVLGIALTPKRRAYLESLDADDLARIHDQLVAQRRWPPAS